MNFYLAAPAGDGTYSPSKHGYFSPEAAATAAPTLNISRFLSRDRPYTVVTEKVGGRLVVVRELGAPAS